MTPSAARRQLGEELRTARDAAGLKLVTAAAHIQRSAATLSRLENGKSVPRLVDVQALVQRYAENAPDAVSNGRRESIFELAETARAVEWFAPFRDVISGDMTGDDIQRYVEFESDATAIVSFESDLVPGLLQTRDYAAAVTEMFFPERTVAERARFVEFRLARQHVLSRPKDPLKLDIVIGELALRRVIGSVEIMREQVRGLLDEVRNGRANITIRIARLALSAPAVIGGPWVLMDLPGPDEPGLVYLESRGGSTYLQTEAAVKRYRHLADDIADAADLDDSQSLLELILKDLG